MKRTLSPAIAFLALARGFEYRAVGGAYGLLGDLHHGQARLGVTQVFGDGGDGDGGTDLAAMDRIWRKLKETPVR